MRWRMQKKRYMFLLLLSMATFSAFSHYENFKTATYYDSNADGLIDSIVFIFSGILYESDVEDLSTNINLPNWRKFTTESVMFQSPGTVVFLVREDRDIPVTYITSNDTIQINEIVLPSGTKLKNHSLIASDGVAPVLISAQRFFYDNEFDSLRVAFSEPVAQFSDSDPFIFKTPQGASYFVNFTSMNIADSIFTAVPHSAQQLNEGDSVFIDTSASITDLQGNVQKNVLNRRVLLTVQQITCLISFSDAYYYDRNADGFIDSIIINSSDVISQNNLPDIIDLITLPLSRNFTIETSSVNQNSIILIVTEGGDEPKTNVNDSDSIIINQSMINDNCLVAGRFIMPHDSVAPVIVRAYMNYHNEGDDTLDVRFSEPVNLINDNLPFLFLIPGQNEYQVTLQRAINSGERYTGLIMLITNTDSIRQGDSIWINTDAKITDLSGNAQSNRDNRRVALITKFLDFPVRFTRAAYYDNSSDGLIDMIKLWYTGPLQSYDLQTLQRLIWLPSVRHFMVQSLSIIDSVVNITVREMSRTPRTGILDGDVIRIGKGGLPEGGVTMEDRIKVIDSIAPVIIRAHLDWYSNDNQILHITFSESVKTFFHEQPFLYVKPDDGQYNVVMNSNSRINKVSYTGNVIRVGDENGIQENDSCWINSSANITDLKSNIQDSYNNRKVPLSVKKHFKIRYLAENSPYLKGKKSVPQPVVQAYSNSGVSMPSDGLVLVVEPDRDLSQEYQLWGTVSIYDVVQNPVIQKKPMVYDKEYNRLYFVWDGRNYNGRDVGTGTYLAVIKVNSDKEKYTGKINVGVKR